MVKEKNSKTRLEALHEMAADYEKNNPVVATKWQIYEVTPAYDTGGYYSEYISERSVRVSPLYDTQAEAEEWMDRHEAEPGKFLAIYQLIARETKSVSWSATRVGK